MLMKKIRTSFITGVLSIAIVIGLLFPASQVKAEEDLETDEYTYTGEDNNVGSDQEKSKRDNSTATEKEVTLGGLVAHWTFDDNFNESVSNLKTTLGAKKLTYTEGIFGKAAVFNGKDNYLVVESASVLSLGNSRDANNDNFTISAWINLGDSLEKEKYLLDKGMQTYWSKDDDCYWTNPYRVMFNTCEPTVTLNNGFEDTNAKIYTQGEASLDGKYVEGGEWFLFTVTYDGNRIKIYRDNELLNQMNYSDGIAFNNEDLFIGADYRLEALFKGAVDDLRIYTKTLSYDEVEDLYQKGLKSNKELVEPTKQLAAYYAFDDNLKDASSFKNNAEKIAVSGTTKYVIGKNGKAITMSKGNYILVPAGDHLNPETEFTVSFWIKSEKEGEYPILYRQNPCYNDKNDNEYTYSLLMNSWNSFENTELQVYTKVYDPDYWVPANGQSLNMSLSYNENKIKSNTWFHYTVTYKDGQMNNYLNGKLFGKSEKSDLVNIANASGDLLIGYNGDSFFTGALDELKIYTKCLTPTEVASEAKRVDSISINNKDTKLVAAVGKGNTVTISGVLLKDGDLGTVSTLKSNDKDLTYKSSNSKIFTVSKTGQIKGVKAGKAKLIITYGGNSVTLNVVVK